MYICIKQHPPTDGVFSTLVGVGGLQLHATSGREGGELHLNIPDQPQMCSIRAYPDLF